jgi:hypothetical protein
MELGVPLVLVSAYYFLGQHKIDVKVTLKELLGEYVRASWHFVVVLLLGWELY